MTSTSVATWRNSTNWVVAGPITNDRRRCILDVTFAYNASFATQSPITNCSLTDDDSVAYLGLSKGKGKSKCQRHREGRVTVTLY